MINLDKLIKTNSAVVNSAATAMTLAGLCLTSNLLIPINPTQAMIPFTSSDQVGKYFGVNSPEYAYAAQYFSPPKGFVNTPPFIWFGRLVDTVASAYIKSGILTSASLPAIRLVTAGAIEFNFNGAAQSLTALDFSGATSLSAVATVLQTALSASLVGATVTYSSQTKALTATVVDPLGNSTVGYCTTGNLASLLNFTQATGAVLSQGSPVLTPAENMTLMTGVSRNWAGFTTIDEIDAITSALFAAWVSGKNNQYAYYAWSSNLITVQALQAAMVENAYANVTVSYSFADFVAACQGAFAGVNYTQRKSTISLANKTFVGIAPLVTDDDTYDLLTAAKINFYGAFASRAQNFNFAEDGSINGQWLYTENLMNQIWLNDALQIATAGLFTVTPRDPYTTEGYQDLYSVADGVMQTALTNGTAEVGVTFNAATVAALVRQSGIASIADTLTNFGYFIQVVPATPDEVANRAPVVVNIWYCNGGSFNKVTFNNRLVIA